MSGLFDDLLTTPPMGQSVQGGGLFDDLLQTKPLSPDDVMTGYPKGKEPTGKSFLDKATENITQIPQAAYEGLAAGSSALGEYATLLGAPIARLAGQDAQDAYFKNVVEPFTKGKEYYQEDLSKRPFVPQVVGGAAQAVPDIGLALMTGGESVAPKAAAVTADVAANLAPKIVQGVKAAMLPAEKAAQATAQQSLAQGETPEQAAARAATTFTYGLAQGVIPAAAVGNLPTRLASGAGLGVLTGQAQRVAEGRPFNEVELGTQAAMGAGFGYLGERAPSRKPEITPTGDPYIDAGQAIASSIKKATERPSVDEVAKKRDAYLENPAAEDAAKSLGPDLFSPEPELGLDMFSGEAIPASKIESRRQAAQDANQGLAPQRTPDEIAALEREYILDQQDKINALQQQTANVTAKQGAIPEPYLGIANADLLEGNPRQIQTRNGEAVGVVDQQPSGAMREAFLRGLAERGQLRNDPVPVERPPLPERATFEPSKVPTVEQSAEQPSLELPTTQDLFQGIKPESRPEPARAPEPVKTAPESSFIAAVQKANEDSVKATGKPLTADAIQALRDKYNKEAPRVTEEQKQAHEQRVKDFGVDAFDQPGHNVPKAYHTNTADVANELEQAMGKDWPKVKESIDNGKLKIVGSVNDVENKDMRKWLLANPDFRPRGWFSKDGTATMLVPNIEKGTVRALLFHEVGGHGGLQQRPQVNKLIDRVLDLASQGNKDAKAAIGRANGQGKSIKNMDNARKRRETLAYFIQHMSEKVQSPKGAVGRALSLYNTLKAEAKLMLADKFGWDRFNITDKDMYALAEGSIRKFSKTGEAKEVPEPENVKQVPADLDLPGDKRSQEQPKEQPRAFLPELEKRVRNLFTAYGTNVKIGRDVLDSKDITGMGQRVVRYTVREFKKAGINAQQRDLVNAALDNDKQALAQLSPKQRTAIKNFRDEVEQLQLRLAAEHPTLKGVDMAPMILESVLKGDYNTRTYRAHTSKPSLWYSIRRDVFGTAKDPYWIEQLAKKAPEALANARDFIYQNIAIPDPKNLSDAQVRDYASWWNVEGENIDSLREQLAEKRARYGEDLNTQTRQIMRDFVERNDQSQVKAVKQVARNPSILMERHNLPEVLRTFLGEEKDPTLRAAFTLSRLGDLLAQQTTLTRIAAKGEGKYLFRKGQVAPEGFKETIPDNDDYGALRGMSTSKDMLDQLRTIVEVQGTAPAQYVRKTGAELFKLWTRNISGPSKLLATVGSHATSLVNLYSNLFGMSRPAVITTAMGKPVKAVVDVAKAPWTALLDEFDKLPKEKLKRYAELGITGDSWQFGELNNTMRDVDYREKQQQSGPVAKALRATKRVAVDNPVEVVKKLYSVPDVALRVSTFVAHADALRRVHPDWTIDQIERTAAQKAKDETPTFSRATPLVKGVSGLTGNFATWSSEVVRTTSNQLLNAVGEIREGYQTGNKQQVRYGLAQLSGTAAYMTAAKLALPALIAYGFGISKKENPEKDNKNASQLAPSYYEGNDLQVVQTDPKTHKIIFVNTSRVDPANPINEIYNRVNDQIEKQGILKGIPSATAAFIYDNYLRPGPMAQAAYQSITNQDQAGNVLPQGERLSPIIKALTPGTVKNIESAEKIRKRSLNDQLAFAKEMGIPMYELDGEQALKSKLYDFRKQTTEAAESFKKAFAKPETLSEDDLKSLYANYVAKEKELFDEAQRSVRAGKETFGLTPSEIQSLFKDTSVEKDYRLPMTRGEFQPKTWYSDDFLIKAEKRAIQADPSNRDEIRRDFQKRRMLLNKFRRNWKELE